MRITEVQAELVRQLVEQTVHHGDLSKIAERTGLSLTHLSRVRSGAVPLPLARVDALAQALGVEVRVEIKKVKRKRP